MCLHRHYRCPTLLASRSTHPSHPPHTHALLSQVLEQLYPDRLPLVPAEGSPERPRYESLMRLERRLFSDWLSWLCNSWWVGRRRGEGQI